jgi:hypothetical protein
MQRAWHATDARLPRLAGSAAMSLGVLLDFFPDASRLLRTTPVWEGIFPAHHQALCPEPAVELDLGGLGALTVRSPVLGAVAAVGLVIGAWGWASLRGGGGTRSAVRAAWARALFWFAAMNATAIVCHSLSIRHPPSTLHTLFLGLDVGCTCASGLCLFAAAAPVAMARWAGGNRSSITKKARAARKQYAPAASRGCLLLASAPAAAVVLAAALINNIAAGPAVAPAARAQLVPWLNEALYLGVLVCLVVPAVAPLLLSAPPPTLSRSDARAARLGAGIAWAGVLVVLSGPLLEGALCTALGDVPHRFGMTDFVFGGCDVMLLGLAMYVRAGAAE